MGCASSSPKETATITAAPPKKTNNDNVDMENTTKKRERETTGGTEAMAAGISVSLASSDAENINPNNNNNQNGVNNNNNNSNKQTSNASSPQPNKSSSSPQNPIPPTSASSPGNNPVKVGNLSLRYAALTHRGRDPDFPTKPNQDRFGHHRNPHSAFFAVYDGHGPHGEKCSDFVRGRLPQLLKTNLQNWKDRRNNNGSNNGEEFFLSVDDIHDSLHDAHIDCNDELRRSEIDDRHSGTTSVGVYLHDDRMTVANVGDSRIVLGTLASSSPSDGRSSIQAIPLSKDHTPYRQDEASRCVSSGARILSFGQIDPAAKDDTEDDDDDDDVEDPPRVWARDGKYPGTAFTRSIGDSVAERFGVCAEPEMVTLPVSTDERLLVLASDGVFDVLSNQAVVDLCYAYRSDPVRAAEAIVERSHEEWLLNDDCCEDDANYDDMTVVIVYFHHKGFNDEDHNITTETTNGGGEDVKAPPRQPRPKGKRVRQKTLQNLEEMGQ
eukprot:CAMPEP_0183711080 /NCGR_PEP_ID=MMETSP0737-20130205/6655_1 /TAXON_ID=385413 /ORGANISM="Thalassiosira miniscula, Strain CCMP1093" /LENGTH=494 /DNA_ID=CAMNT_0025939491 /DNA_START=109 /DNA_END=1593 /DNA_ORIENTATION=-